MSELKIHGVVKPEELKIIIASPRDIEKASEFDVAKLPDIVTKYKTYGATLYEDGQPIVSGGITIINHPAAIAWLVASKPIKPYLNYIMPAAKKYMEVAKVSNLKLVAQITDGLAPAEKFAGWFGFQPKDKIGERTRTWEVAK